MQEAWEFFAWLSEFVIWTSGIPEEGRKVVR
jgi:hypothetical protein